MGLYLAMDCSTSSFSPWNTVRTWSLESSLSLFCETCLELSLFFPLVWLCCLGTPVMLLSDLPMFHIIPPLIILNSLLSCFLVFSQQRTHAFSWECLFAFHQCCFQSGARCGEERVSPSLASSWCPWMTPAPPQSDLLLLLCHPGL